MSLTPEEMETLDLRSPRWLEDPISFVDKYYTDDEIADLLMSDREVLKTFLSTLGCSLSNRQVRESANSATRWINDLNSCEETEGLTNDMKLWRVGHKAILAWINSHRAMRSTYSTTNPNQYRRQ
jgi:hypothetical protein